jgi:hypothetical protein
LNLKVLALCDPLDRVMLHHRVLAE